MAAVKKAVQAMVTDKRAITADEAKAAMQDLFAGTSTQAQTGAFLTSLQVGRPETTDAFCLPACAVFRSLAGAEEMALAVRQSCKQGCRDLDAPQREEQESIPNLWC
jgi:anthranilate phosphoribosyltransferase